MNFKQSRQQLAQDQALRKLTSIQALRPECKAKLSQSLEISEKQSGDFLLRLKQPANRFWFIARGLVKAYYLSSSKEQRVFSFYWDDDFLIDTYHLYHEKRYPYYIECIEECILISITYEAHLDLLKNYSDYALLHLKLAGITSRKAEIRNKILSKKAAALRYESFCKKHPVRARIPANDIASYLCISRSRLDHIL